MTDTSDCTQERAELLFASAQQLRIGSRVTDGTTGYTIVALILGKESVRPYYLADDWETNAQFAWLTQSEMDDEDAVSIPDDPEIAKRARAHAATEREFVTHHGANDVLWDNPTSADQVQCVLEFGEADRVWRIAESAQRKAARDRALSIAQVAWAAGTQTAAGRLLGLDQSRVSRAVEAAHAATGGDTT